MTLGEALNEEDNVLLPLSYSSQREYFFFWIYEYREDFKALVSLHLSLAKSETCRFGEFKEWKHGSFNVCIPIYIDNWRKYPRKRVLLRLPLPYKVGESTCPGNADEKLRTEAAAFIWIQENCSDVPIPFLWGFGFTGGQSVQTPMLSFGTYAGLRDDIVYEARKYILDDENGVAHSTCLIMVLYTCPALSIYKPYPPRHPRPRISDYGLYRDYRCRIAFRVLGRTPPRS